MDWCTQMNNVGYELWYEPRCTIFHKESQSAGKKSITQLFYMTRNRLLYAKRNRLGLIKWLALVYQLIIAIPKQYIYHIIKREKDLSQAILDGTKSFFKI